MALAGYRDIDFSESVVDGMLKRLFQKRQPDNVSPEIWNHEFTQMADALVEGYGKTGTGWGGTDWEFVQNLRYNTAVFDAFKCNREIKEAYKLLTWEDGTAKTWKEFRRDAMRVCEQYNQRWLQTEFNQAHAAAKSARKWQNIERNADLYPNLRYIAVQDKRTRHSHAELHGYVIPIDHPFWDKYYPPNDWNCRCSVQPTDDPVRIPPGVPAVPEIFQTNPGKTAQVFDISHPYYKGMTEAEKDRVYAFVRQNIRPAKDVLNSWDEYEALGSEWKKDYFNGNNGGFLATHSQRIQAGSINKNERQKYEKEAEMCKVFARSGYRVEHQAEIPGVSSPDVLIDGKAADLKRVSSHNNMVRHAEKAVTKQGAEEVLFQFDNMTDKIREELGKIKKKGIRVKYFVTGKETEIHTL